MDDFFEFVLFYVAVAAFVLLILFYPGTSHAAVPREIGVYCVIGEAEGGSDTDREAVACAIKRRGTTDGVYGCTSDRIKNHLYSSKSLTRAILAWEKATKNHCASLTGNANSWYSWADIDKYGHQKCPITAQTNSFVFYNCKL